MLQKVITVTFQRVIVIDVYICVFRMTEYFNNELFAEISVTALNGLSSMSLGKGVEST